MIQKRIEPGDFVAVPEYIGDDELLDLQFSLDSIRRLRRGEYIAGSFLAQGTAFGGRGQGRARGMVPGGERLPTWRIDNLSGSILIMPDHMLVVSKGPPPPKPYVAPDLGVDFDLDQLIELVLENEGVYPSKV